MAARSEDSVCVCIAAYNAEGTIARAITSALQQAHVTEVIVVDDASTDATANAAHRCDDGSGRLSVLDLEQNRGPSAARNRALNQSRAGVFCVLDSDDYFLPGRIDRLLSADCGEWHFLADDILILPEDAGADTPGLQCSSTRPVLELDLPNFVLNNISNPRRPRAELGFLKPLVRRKFLDTHMLRYEENMRLSEDYALYVRALMAGAKFKVAGFCGYVAVERANSLSSTHSAADLAAVLAFDTVCSKSTSLTDAARQALAAHQRATTDKWVLARALEIRRERGIVPALHFLVRQPRNAGYVVSEILHAKYARLRLQFWGEQTDAPRRPRRLMGAELTGTG